MYYFKQTNGRTIGDKYVLIIIDKASKTQAMDRTTGNSPVIQKIQVCIQDYHSVIILSDMTEKIITSAKINGGRDFRSYVISGPVTGTLHAFIFCKGKGVFHSDKILPA